MRLTEFQVTNYRNIRCSGWIEVDDITAFVGQNEAGKSNLFDALYRLNPFVPDERYHIDEDWPVDNWDNKDKSNTVCEAKFALDEKEIRQLVSEASTTGAVSVPLDRTQSEETTAASSSTSNSPGKVSLVGSRSYESGPKFRALGDLSTRLDPVRVDTWAKAHVPKFVLVQDYGISGTRTELERLAERRRTAEWSELNDEEQTISMVLDLAGVDLEDFLSKGNSADGRTTRSFDKRSASSHLSAQFGELWRQKGVKFHIEIDGPTLNILAEDDGVGMPVQLHRRSSGFRWYASFAWKFTHASKGEYKDCILLLEEPGIHLHHDGQLDLLEVLERLSRSNMVLYTTHLASMIDLAHPERVRIVEVKDNHATVKKGVVSTHRAPMAVIELSLGLTGDMSDLLGSRQPLIVAGWDDVLILQRLSKFLQREKKIQLSDRIHLWPASSAEKTPMFAAFALDQRWDSGVLLDSDKQGNAARRKIEQWLHKDSTNEHKARFRVLMLGEKSGIRKNEAAIEDLFGDAFYVDCVNSVYGVAIKEANLPNDGSSLIAVRTGNALTKQYGLKLDKKKVLSEILNRFDTWKKLSDLPDGLAQRTEKLIRALNDAFAA